MGLLTHCPMRVGLLHPLEPARNRKSWRENPGKVLALDKSSPEGKAVAVEPKENCIRISEREWKTYEAGVQTWFRPVCLRLLTGLSHPKSPPKDNGLCQLTLSRLNPWATRCDCESF